MAHRVRLSGVNILTEWLHAVVKPAVTSIFLFCLCLSICACAHRPPPAATAASYDLECKNRAYSRMVLADFLSTRFHSHAPVRLAVMPFSVPANLSAYNSERPGLGNQLAWDARAELVRAQAAPIVEVLNRYDWPGKKDEFFTGNYSALATAREAGYDLVLIGYLEPMHSLNEMVLYSKLIEVESGITVWNGQSTVSRATSLWGHTKEFLDLERRVPSSMQFEPMLELIVRCMVQGITDEDPV